MLAGRKASEMVDFMTLSNNIRQNQSIRPFHFLVFEDKQQRHTICDVDIFCGRGPRIGLNVLQSFFAPLLYNEFYYCVLLLLNFDIAEITKSLTGSLFISFFFIFNYHFLSTLAPNRTGIYRLGGDCSIRLNYKGN